MKSYADGGYLTGWNDAEHFKPEDREHIVFALAISDDFDDGVYHADDGNVYKLSGYADDIPFYHVIPFSAVDYWMHIPPTPKGRK